MPFCTMAVAWCTLPCDMVDGSAHDWCCRAASAVFHDSSRILLAAVKFFLGQDEIAEGVATATTRAAMARRRRGR